MKSWKAALGPRNTPLFVVATLGLLLWVPATSRAQIRMTVSAGSSWCERAAPRVSFEEKLLATIPEDFKEPEVGWWATFSCDGSRVAYAAKQNGKEFLVVEGKRGPSFDILPPLYVFSPDGNTVAYLGVNWNVIYVVIGEKRALVQIGGIKEGPLGGLLHATLPLDLWAPEFSPDGTKVAYPRTWDLMKMSIAIVDDKSAEYKSLEKGEDFTIVLGHGGPEFHDVASPVFSPDGKQLAYAARLWMKWFIVVGDNRGPEFDDIGRPVFSPDGKTVAYRADLHHKRFIVVGDNRGPEFDDIGVPVFSPDGKTVAYWAGLKEKKKEKKKELIVIGDKQGAEADAVGRPVFSPEGKKVAYGAFQGRELWWKVVDVH
jgi:roadblock/LC7 domain-containing protein